MQPIPQWLAKRAQEEEAEEHDPLDLPADFSPQELDKWAYERWLKREIERASSDVVSEYED